MGETERGGRKTERGGGGRRRRGWSREKEKMEVGG